MKHKIGLPDLKSLEWCFALGLEETFEIICSYEYLTSDQIRRILGL